ncbi:MAG TPA: type II secretion system protein [Candidatus Omnitrophota bacterium]|nr:type II secretion system protein [Candidatus Omnitrophota bacterium]HNQ50365.1 type II secretion system protein [Candidatus Omnitrophota bacterium]HQQ06722.1 type II secretion system protein [Candidatus Omnitrophota bacterium]
MRRGLTLVEILIALVLFGVVITVVGALVHYSAATYMGVQKELGEGSSQGMRFFDTVMQRVMRAKKTQIRDDNKTLVITYKQDKQEINALITLEGDTIVYYPREGNAEKQVLASGVKGVEFTHDFQMERDWTVGNPVPDGVWAPVYYYNSKGPERVAVDVEFVNPFDAGKTVHMRTAVVPRLASATQERVAWLSPALQGRLMEVQEIANTLYAAVQARYVAMHTPAGVQAIDPATIMVAVPLNLRVKLQQQMGKEIMFMGDVLPGTINGSYAMQMNKAYGGGVIFAEDQIEEAKQRINAGSEAWYEAEVKRLAPVFDDARKRGVDLSDWKAVWELLRVTARGRLGT